MEVSQIKISPDNYEKYGLSHGHRVGDFIFTSGQTAMDDSRQLVGVGNFAEQAKQVFKNLERVLTTGGSSFKNVIKLTVLLRDIADMREFIALKKLYFSKPYPAETLFQVASLYSPDALIEIEAIAVADNAANWTGQE